jgi:superfamily II DNA helicase RecQ
VNFKVAEAVGDSAFSSDNQPSFSSEETNVNCPNCFILKEQLQLAVQELESAKTIISLLRNDNISSSVPPSTDNPTPSVITTANTHNHVDPNWIPVKHKVNKKKIAPYNTARKAALITISTNRFSPLDNLKVNQEEVITVNDSVNLSTSSSMKNTNCHLTGSNKIPTIISGIVKNSDIQNPSKTKSKPLRSKPDKSIKCDHKVCIIGDSHLKESATKIN